MTNKIEEIKNLIKETSNIVNSEKINPRGDLLGDFIFNFNQFEKGLNKLREESEVLKIGIVGQVKAGKSSFLNALLFDGESILPSASTPMTAGLTVLEYNNHQKFVVEYYIQEEWAEFEKQNILYEQKAKEINENPEFRDAPEEIKLKFIINQTTQIQQSAHELIERCNKTAKNKIGKNSEAVSFENISELKTVLNQYVGAEGEFTSVVKSLHIFINDERLKGIKIVDTPGVNDPIVSRENRTREFLHSCHGVFLLSFSSRFFDSTDVSFMNNRIGSHGIAKVLLLASKYDSVLQDLGMQYPDDLDSADTHAQKKLKEIFDDKKKELEGYENIDFDTTSAIAFSILKKDIKYWNNIERHIYMQLSRFYPSYFIENIEAEKDLYSVKEVLSALSNLDKIKEEYLQNKFISNKTEIISKKKSEYKEKQCANLSLILDDIIKKIKEDKEFIEAGDLEQLDKQEKSQGELFSSIKNELEGTVSGFSNTLQSEIDRIYERNKILQFGDLPTEQKQFFYEVPGLIWGTSTESVFCDIISSEKVKTEGEKKIDDTEVYWRDKWEKIFKNSKDIFFEHFCSIITEAQKDIPSEFNHKYFRSLGARLIDDLKLNRELKLREEINKRKNEFICFCNSQEFSYFIKNTTNSQKATEDEVKKINNNLHQKINQDLESLNKDLKSIVNKNSKDVMNKLDGLKDNLAKSLSKECSKYNEELKDKIKNKTVVVEDYNKAINKLTNIKNNINEIEF
ncbi:MAG: dynamin family protein [Bacteroidales bacterium]